MRKVDKNIESMIVRRLDGELAEQDELTLDRELIRNPDAREMLESYEAIDRLATAALSDAIGARQTQIDVESIERHRMPSRGVSSRWVWQLATGAIAAAILAVFVARFNTGPSATQAPMAESLQSQPIPQVIPSAPNLPGREDVMRNAATSGPRSWRDTGRGTFAVVGDDGNLYWIGVDRTRTAKLNRSERM